MRNLRITFTTVLLLTAMRFAGATVPSHAVIFMYHRFGDPHYPSTNTRTEQFAAQLDWLARNHYQVWSLPRIVDDLRTDRQIPDHVVGITIDGAFRSMYEHAFPLLEARHLPFTVFVSSDDIDRRRPDFMTWGELRDLLAHSGTIANDSADSGHLAFHLPGESERNWAARVRADILRGQQRLESELGTQVNTQPRLFAYPYGEFSARLAGIVTALGFAAFGQQSGVLAAPPDIRAMPRFPLNQHYGSVSQFALRAAALPMPIRSVRPWDPEVAHDNPPLLQVRLVPGAIPSPALHCYLDGPPLEITWLDAKRTQFAVRASSPLPVGHDRYDCTARVNGRYFWYSHMWVVPPR